MRRRNGEVDSGNGKTTSAADEEKRIIKELMDEAESNIKPGNLYYLVSTRWFRRWQRYTGHGVDELGGMDDDDDVDSHNQLDYPGPIDNSDLVSSPTPPGLDSPLLLPTLEEVRDYVLLPQLVWDYLLHWYKGGPALPRQLISQGAISTFIVEVYPLCLNLTDSRDGSHSVLRLSKKASVLKLYEKVCELKGLQQDKACIWDYFNGQKQCLLVPSEQTLEDAHLQMDQQILLEVQGSAKVSYSEIGPSSAGNELAIVPMELSRSSMTIGGGPVIANGYSTRHSSGLHSGPRSSPDDVNDRHEHDGTISVRKKEKGGLAGLQNLGNTCFMNSAVQCLAHTGPLVEYFLQDYSHEINKQNPLGMHGELAVAFGDLLRNIWSAGRTTIAPRVFKGKLARFAPQFSGYNQHDSQELLAFLLDGLHEDLNRVKQKPYIEMKDSDGRPDEDYADECWNNHKARNDSIIVDTCQGQYKSTLICPVCNKISITFDPFMYLTLPLPSTVNRTMTVTVFYGDGSGLPMPYTVTVSKNGCCKDLREALGTASCLGNDETLLLAEVYDHKIYRYLEIPLEPLSSIKDDEHIVAYRVPKKRSGLKRLVMLHQSFEKKLIGSPLVTYLGEEFQTVADLNVAVERIMSPLRRAQVSSCRMDSEEGKGTDSQVGGILEDILVENDGGSSICNNKLHYQLSVTEDRGFGGKQLDDDYVKRSSFIRATLNWTDREHELYDVSYLEDLPEVCKSSFSTKKTRQEGVSLFSCLDAFLKEEPLGPDDMWYCPCCKEHRQATKKLDLWRLPEILVIHLKRFSYSRYLKNKLDTFVSFPIRNLDLCKYVKSNNVSDHSHTYELYAISNHYGGLGGGHYSAYAKLIDEDRWYHFDDSHVSPVSETEIKTSAAYVLFYRRMKAEARSVG